MPWKEVSSVSQREELVALAQHEGRNLTELCRRFGVSRKTAYKWMVRAAAGANLADGSRRPHHSPGRCPEELEQRVVGLRREHPAWGARKLRRVLQDRQETAAAVSTVHRILVRQGLIEAEASRKHTAYLRFEYPQGAAWPGAPSPDPGQAGAVQPHVGSRGHWLSDLQRLGRVPAASGSVA
jgi:transposase-like protein